MDAPSQFRCSSPDGNDGIGCIFGGLGSYDAVWWLTIGSASSLPFLTCSSGGVERRLLPRGGAGIIVRLLLTYQAARLAGAVILEYRQLALGFLFGAVTFCD